MRTQLEILRHNMGRLRLLRWQSEADAIEARRLVAANRCPECREALDTGYECTECGFDAASLSR